MNLPLFFDVEIKSLNILNKHPLRTAPKFFFRASLSRRFRMAKICIWSEAFSLYLWGRTILASHTTTTAPPKQGYQVPVIFCSNIQKQTEPKFWTEWPMYWAESQPKRNEILDLGPALDPCCLQETGEILESNAECAPRIASWAKRKTFTGVVRLRPPHKKVSSGPSGRHTLRNSRKCPKSAAWLLVFFLF